jgi:hypothetical protein
VSKVISQENVGDGRMTSSGVSEVIGAVKLGDRRLENRLCAVVEALAQRPEASIPSACESWAATLGAYRLMDNPAVEPEAIVEAAAEATAKRAVGQSVVLAVQDTTSIDYTEHGATTELGYLDHPDRRGLMVHTTLAVTEDGVPLGLVDQQIWARDLEQVGRRHQRKQIPIEGKESMKWLKGLQAAEARVGSIGRVVTVADREADVYELFALAECLRGDWLIRARHDRRLVGQEPRLTQAVKQAPLAARVAIEVPRRADQPPQRTEVDVRFTRVELLPPPQWGPSRERWWDAHPTTERIVPEPLPSLTVGVVLVEEVHPPHNQTPIRWLLLTSLPLETAGDALRAVAYYRLRWLIERFHYVLKSGCQVERLQFDSGQRLIRALTIYSLVASWLLYVTYQARAHPTTPASAVLDPESWQALYAFTHPGQPIPLDPPPLDSTIRMIARLGGFLARKHDGAPGVKTIWRGLRRLTDITLTYRLLTASSPIQLDKSTYV